MCVEIRKRCQCGKQTVQFHMRDNILSQEVVADLHCPECSGEIELNYETMLMDNGWVIEYDMDLARFLIISKLLIEPENIQPGYIFDNGYACWLEMYPGEKDDIISERTNIINLQKTDQKLYLQKISNWNINRVEQLKTAGWRKAQAA